MTTNKIITLLPKVNVSFSGCGFLGVYHAGSYACLKEYQDKSLQWVQNAEQMQGTKSKNKTNKDGGMSSDFTPHFAIDKALGASAGALVAASLLIDYPPETLKNKILELTEFTKSMYFGPFNPRFDVNKIIRDILTEALPKDANILLSNRLYISITGTYLNNLVVSQFSSNEEVIEALICSCYLPAFSSYQIPKYKGESYIDGGFSNNLPIIDEKTTVRITPFSGTGHICPDDGTPPEKMWLREMAGETVEISAMNIKRFKEALYPPKDLELLYSVGYQHTKEFIRSGKIGNFFMQAEN